MKTRSQTKKEQEAMVAEFTPKFFESSSKAWMANKERYDQAMYRYKDGSSTLRRSKRLQEKESK